MPAELEPTALDHIWLGRRLGVDVVVKHCARATEGRVYRELAGPLSLPAPHLIDAIDEPGGEGCWLLLEPVTCTPPGLSARAATHWWQNGARRDRVVVMLAALHAQSMNQPQRLAEVPWLPRYGDELFWTALERLEAPPAGWSPLSRAVLGQLASSAEMLIAGPRTLIHGSVHPNNVGWRGESPVLLDWEKLGWGTPYADLGRLLTRCDTTVDPWQPLTAPAWRPPLLASYAATLEVVAGARLEPDALALAVRSGMLWESAVDLWLQARDPLTGERARYEAGLVLLEALADEP